MSVVDDDASWSKQLQADSLQRRGLCLQTRKRRSLQQAIRVESQWKWRRTADDNSEYTYTVGKTFDTVMGLSVVTGRDSALSSDLCPCSTSSSCFMSLDLMGLTGLDAKTGIKTLLIAPTNAGNEEQVIKRSANSDDSDHLLSSEDLIRSLCTDSGMQGIPELDNITRTNDRTTCRYKEILSYSAVENEDGVQAFFQVAEEVSKDCSVYLTVKNTDKYSLPTTLFTNKSTSTVASGENFGGKLVLYLQGNNKSQQRNWIMSWPI